MDHNWYAVYTQSNTELKLQNCILNYSEENALDYQVYLPLTTQTKQWSDRKKQRQIALFKNYLFVRHDISGFHQIKKLPGFCDYVRFGQYPAVIAPAEINMIRTVLSHQKEVCCKPKGLLRGDKVRICHGPLANYQGILIEDQSGSKVAIEVKKLQQYLQVDVPLSNIARI